MNFQKIIYDFSCVLALSCRALGISARALGIMKEQAAKAKGRIDVY